MGRRSASAAASSASGAAAPDRPTRRLERAAGARAPAPSVRGVTDAADDDLLASHGGWPGLLTELLAGRDLTADQARSAMATILGGHATRRPADRLRRRAAGQGRVGRRAVGAARRGAGGGRAGGAGRRAARPGRRHRRHRRRPLALDQRVDDGRHRRRRRRRPGVQARGPRRVVAVRHGRRVRGARRRHRAVAGRGAALRRGGRHRLLLRPPLPPGVPLRRPGAARDRHPDRVQPARPDGQPGPGAPPGDRRRRRPVRRADAGVAAGPRLDRRLGRPRRGPRRADHDRAVDRAGAAARRRGPHVHRRPGRARPGAGDARAARRGRPDAQRRGRAPGPRRRARAPIATSWCSTRPPGSSSPASPASLEAGIAAAEASIDGGGAAAALAAMVRVSQEAAAS